MNKKGNIFFGLGIFVLIYVFGMLFLPFIIDDIDTTRIDLDCGNSAISTGSKMNCLLTDILTPYFILFVIAAAGGFLINSNT